MSASDTASAEVDDWAWIASLAEDLADVSAVPATEQALTGFDPTDDLARRTRGWMYSLPDNTLAELARFAGGLAQAEASAWERDDPSVATRALSDRRFLFGDRIVHWAVPWALAHSDATAHGTATADGKALTARLLTLGEHHRPAPEMSGGEGLHPPGTDSIGPIAQGAEACSLLAGWVLTEPTRARNRDQFVTASATWKELAETYPGTARLWMDMSARAQRSAGQVLN